MGFGAFAFVVGCGGEAAPTWAQDVSPIIYGNCVSCHREGGIAPFSLTTYDEVVRRASAIKTATAARTMPPSPINASGSCNSYRDARWLSDADIATLGRWADQGTPAGDMARAPSLPRPPAGLSPVDLRIQMPETYTPNATLTDDYRCFVVDPGVAADRFVTGFEVLPGESKVVHHVILFSVENDSAQRRAEELDAAEPGPGYTCFGSSRVGGSPLALWAPGGPPTIFPSGTGLRLPGHRKVVLQVHYNLEAGALPDRTTVNLRLADQVRREAYLMDFEPSHLTLPPGMAHVEATESTNLGNLMGLPSVWALGVAPHMHTLGRTLNVSVQHEGTNQCMVQVDNWDFHWQQLAFYEHPVQVLPNTHLNITCGYDTRERTTTTTWGESTTDEMCLAYFYVTLANPN